jgi:hypothetical protein
MQIVLLAQLQHNILPDLLIRESYAVIVLTKRCAGSLITL